MVEVTYQLPENVIADALGFRREVDRFVAEEISAEEFKPACASMGIYQEREDGSYMLRVRGAAGLFLAHQVKLVAELARVYGNGVVHVTTRQDLQIHGVGIADIPDILERLLEAGLASRGGGGNTVRNVSTCPFAGACGDEVFDVTPYALALTEYMLRDPASFTLPRKFKVALSGCDRDCGLCSVTDLGFFAHERDGVRGFAVYAGGGMGARSALGILLEEFVPAESVFEIAEALKRVFDKHGDRTNRSRARLRYVVERFGAERFREVYREGLELVRGERIVFPAVAYQDRDKGSVAVEARLSQGDIDAGRLRALADVALDLGDGTLRASQDQDLQLRVWEDRAEAARLALTEIDEGFVHQQPVRCVSCIGATVCRSGLRNSSGLASAIEDELGDLLLPFEAAVRISGCHNSCGQHPVAALGLYGGVLRVDGRVVPSYTIVAGGRLAEGSSELAQAVGKVPARAVPALLREFWIAAEENRRGGELLDDLMSRWGIGYLRELVNRYESVPSFEEAPEYYCDIA